MPADARRAPPRARTPRQPDAARDYELALQAQATERANRRGRWIKVAGALAFFVSPLSVFLIGGYSGAPVVVLLLPPGIGASIAFFGMTMTDHRRDVAEWGLVVPSKCLAYGTAPYLLLPFLAFAMLFYVLVWAAITWMVTILIALFTASIIDRWFYKES